MMSTETGNFESASDAEEFEEQYDFDEEEGDSDTVRELVRTVYDLKEGLEERDEVIRRNEMMIAGLVRENQRLRNQVDSLEEQKASRGTLNQMVGALIGAPEDVKVDDHPIVNRDLALDAGKRLNQLQNVQKQIEAKVNDVHDGSSNGPEGAWMDTVRAARNLQNDRNHGLPNNRVKLFKENIAQATGRSKKMAQNYIEDWGEEKPGTDWQPYKRATAANNGKAQKKALILDMDVWGEDDD